MKNSRRVILAGMILALVASGAIAGGFLTNGLPPAGGSQYPTTIPLTGAETIPADTNLSGGLSPQSESVTTQQLGAYVASQPNANGFRNSLIGGDFTTNLWQRGVTSGAITTTATFTADRWIAWSGTGTAMTVARSSTAGDVAAGYLYAAKVARTAAQTGVLPVCIAQVLESADSYKFQGQTAELTFHITTGATFSSTSGGVTAYVGYGTGVDGSSAAFAFGINGGGGGGAGWTGQTNVSALGLVGAGAASSRWTMYASIPSTATQVGVAICWTPVGTAGASDYMALSGVQLARNSAGSAYASTLALSSTRPALGFERKPIATETGLQLRHFWALSEPAASISVAPSGQGASTTTCVLSIPLPVSMRIAPTAAFAGTALGATTWTVTHVVTNTVLSTPFMAATTGGSTVNMLNVTATTGATLTAGQTCTLTGAAGGSIIQAGADL